MKKVTAYRLGQCIIIKNNAAGRPGRFDTYHLSPAHEKADRVGCELTLDHSVEVAEKANKEDQ